MVTSSQRRGEKPNNIMLSMEFAQKSFVGFLVEGGRTSRARFAKLVQMDDCGQNMFSFAFFDVIDTSIGVGPSVTVLVQVHLRDDGQLLGMCSFQ